MGILRFLLAISVVIAHSTSVFGLKLVSPVVAVQSFYVISGFYMALILSKKYKDKGFKLFFINRLLRIYPIYWVVLLTTILLVGISVLIGNSSSKLLLWQDLIGHGIQSFYLLFITLFSTVFVFFQDWMVFLNYNSDAETIQFVADFHETGGGLYSLMFIPQAWTISVELTFYLLAPFLVKQSNRVLIILVSLSIIFRVIMYQNGFNYDPWTYRFFPFEITFFILGIFSFRLFEKIKNKAFKFSNYALLYLLILTFMYQFYQSETTGYIYIIIVALLIPFIFKKYKWNTFDQKIGELSYPIYICHITIWLMLEKLPLPFNPNGLLLIILSIFASLFLNYFISRPIERFRQRRVKLVTLTQLKTNDI